MPRKKSQHQRYHSRRQRLYTSRHQRKQQQRRQQQRQQQQRQQQQQRGGDVNSTSLASILPTNSFYPYNNYATSLPNPMDTRALQHQLAHAPNTMQRGGARETGSRSRKHKVRTIKYTNYAGRQIGCRSRTSISRASARSRSRTHNGRRQAGGDSLNYLPSDANMILRSASTFAGNLWAGLKGVHGAPSALPFEDQALQSVDSK